MKVQKKGLFDFERQDGWLIIAGSRLGLHAQRLTSCLC